MKVTGILLAGGKSSRMRREKGSLIIGGRMMYEYPLKALEGVCDEILISGSTPLPGNLPYPTIPDRISNIGPIGGIHTCLEHSSNELNLVLSYDLPLVNEGLLKYLIQHSKGHDIVAPALKAEQAEPLCALYRKSTQPVFEELIKQKRYAVHRALNLVPSLVLPLHPGMSFYSPNLFLNINSKEDLENLPGHLGDTI